MSSLAYLGTGLNYFSPPLGLTKLVYTRAPSQITPLSARTMGTWSLISGTARLVVAYNPTDRGAYGLALFTFLAADAHWLSEWLVYGTTDWEAVKGNLLLDIGTPALMAAGWARGWYF